MQSGLLLHARRLHQLNKSSKCALRVHHLKYIIVFAIATIVEEEGGHYVKSRVIIFLSHWSASGLASDYAL